jgi:hypothetical protein
MSGLVIVASGAGRQNICTRTTKTIGRSIIVRRTLRCCARSATDESTRVRVAQVEKKRPLIAQHPPDLAEHFDHPLDV